MKKAEDFRKAFGPAEAGFERTVRNTLNKLLLQEDKSAFRRLYRYRIPALAMAMVLLLSVGFMGLTGRLGVIAVPDQTRTGAAQYTVAPIETSLSTGTVQGSGDDSASALWHAAHLDLAETDPDLYLRGRLWHFFVGWATKDTDKMLKTCSYAWRKNQDDPAASLMAALGDAVPQSYQINSMSGEAGDQVRTAACTLCMGSGADGNPVYQQLLVDLQRSSGNYYDVDPSGLVFGPAEGNDPAAETVTLDDDGIVSSYLAINCSRYYENMVPLHLVSTDNGIRLEVISAWIEEDSNFRFVISLQDTENKYEGKTLSTLFSTSLQEYAGYSIDSFFENKPEHKSYKILRFNVTKPESLQDDDILFSMDTLRVLDEKEIDMVPYLQQYGQTTEGVTPPGRDPADSVRVLDYTNPLNIQLFRTVYLTGIGRIGDQIHLQFHNTDLGYLPVGNAKYNGWDIQIRASEDSTGYSPISWSDPGDEWATWQDYALNITENSSLNVTVSILTDVFTEGWNIRIPLAALLTAAGMERDSLIPENPAAPEPAAEEPEASRTEDTGTEPVIASMQDTGRPYALWPILCGWAGGDTAAILEWCLPEWKANTGNPQQVIENNLLARGTPKSFQLNKFENTDDDSVNQVLVTLELDPGDGSKSKYVKMNATFRKDTHDVLYLDPFALVITENAKPDADRKMISLSEESILHANLEAYYPDICEKLIPVNLSCEKQGIRLEIISALVRGEEAWFLYSLEDLEGRYTGSELFSDLSDNLDIPVTGSGAPLYTSASGHKVIRMRYTKYSDPVDTSDGVINMNVTDLYVEQNVSVDLSPIIARYAETTEGIAQKPVGGMTYWQNSKSNIDLHNMNLLDPSTGPNLSLCRDGILSGIGWIDGKLHVQFSGPEGSIINCTFNNKSVKTGDSDIHYYLADVRWTDKGARKERVERVLDWQPEDPDQTHLEADFRIAVMAIEDEWVIPVSLLSILENTGE